MSYHSHLVLSDLRQFDDKSKTRDAEPFHVTSHAWLEVFRPIERVEVLAVPLGTMDHVECRADWYAVVGHRVGKEGAESQSGGGRAPRAQEMRR